MWGINSPQPHFTLEGHEKGVNCVEYFSGGDRPYLVSGADDRTVKVRAFLARRYLLLAAASALPASLTTNASRKQLIRADITA